MVPGVEKLPVSVSAPPFALVKKRLVLDALVAKKLVEVALVVVPSVTVSEEMVDEAYAVRPPLNCVSVEVALPARLNGYADASPAPVM